MTYLIDFDLPTVEDVLHDVATAIYDSNLPGEYHLAMSGRTVHVWAIVIDADTGDRVREVLPPRIDAAADENRVIDGDGDTHDASPVADFVLNLTANVVHPFAAQVNMRRQAGEALPSPECWQRVWTRHDG